MLRSLSPPDRHWRMMRKRELHWPFWLHSSEARTQSRGSRQPDDEAASWGPAAVPWTPSSGDGRGEGREDVLRVHGIEVFILWVWVWVWVAGAWVKGW